MDITPLPGVPDESGMTDPSMTDRCEVDDHLWIVDGDRLWDLGPADLDADGDGVADSVSRIGPDELTVYTDIDADGQVHAVRQVGADGQVRAFECDERGAGWVSSDRGRLR